MFNKKLKQRILELENKLSETEKKLAESQNKLTANLDEIRWLKWQLDNPPKYKKGDKFGDLIVVSNQLKRATLGNYISHGIGMLFAALLFHKDKKYIKSLEENYKKDTDTHYEYELTNIITGNKSRLKEFELTNIKGFSPTSK